MKKLFGGLNITWPKLIIWAVIAGVYTGIMAYLPQTTDTSFADISIHFDWWILFGILIIVNSKTPVESALKCFVFFLISQPIVYLVQVPFNVLGWGIFGYYKYWFIITLLTLPMGYVGWYMRKNKWWSILILFPMLLFLGQHYGTYLTEVISFFPNHLLSTIFCLATMIIYPLYVFDDKKIKRAALIISIVIIIFCTALVAVNGPVSYHTDLLISDTDITPDFDDTYTVEFTDPSYGDLNIRYEESIESYIVGTDLRKLGQTQVILRSPEGEEYVYDIIVERHSYKIKSADSDEWRD